ncbi:MAG: FHA domain-containing protein [Fimbriimonadaceae bacterium]|nr:FHA domain-containing protein [Fimbriimonadaceae bacterium]QYK57731.1 MAG: FHA domain-containing protein [Fimbriimonadaceae bacterium]
MGGTVLRALVCGAAGAVAWVLCEPFFPRLVGGLARDPRWSAVELALFLLLGTLVGLAAGVLHGLRQGSRRAALSSGGLGALFGAVGGGLGHFFGSAMFTLAGGDGVTMNPFARTLAFIPMGLMLGAAIGASQRTLRGFVSGSIGGAIAGFVLGASFDPIALVLSPFIMAANLDRVAQGGQVEIGGPARAVTCFGLGLFVGLFTALFDHVTRQAWLRLTLGRNEGREWPIDAQQTLVGRDERAHVPVFSDPQVPALAAVIVREQGGYILKDPSSPIGVGHNGIRVQEAPLQHGDTIQIGSLSFEFLMRAGARNAAEGRARAVPIGGQRQPVQPTSPVPSVAPVQPAAAPTLVVMNGPMTGQRFPVQGPTEIGREGSGVRLFADAQASRRHAQVEFGPAGVSVTDLGSTNGTFVNGQRITSSPLRPGDIVTVGSTQLRLEA